MKNMYKKDKPGVHIPLILTLNVVVILTIKIHTNLFTSKRFKKHPVRN